LSEQKFGGLLKVLNRTVEAIATLCEKRDPYTAGHQRRVAQLACAIAREMGLPDEQIHGIRITGVVHDIGKIAVPGDILSKPGKLSTEEFNIVKTHPQVAYDVLRNLEFPWPVAEIILQHHERLDGSGYPNGISGEAIILEARILCVADVVEAMASHRPYRPALGTEKALNEIKQNRGVLYDPMVADACSKLSNNGGLKLDGE
jgi:putative nucleotidyltransferase with HDIG domain